MRQLFKVGASCGSGALHAALTVLEKRRTMSFKQVSARTIEYTERGFPL